MITQPLFAKALELVSCMEISTSGKLRGKLKHDGKYYGMTGASYGGKGGKVQAHGREIINFDLYFGDLEPMEYGAHQDAVRAGKRERGYAGIMVKQGGKVWVFVGESVTFEAIPNPEQGTLF